MQRPALSKHLSEAEFRAWYWLKSELVNFCKIEGLPVIGPKQELAEIISAYLGSRQLPVRTRSIAQTGKMPASFSPETVIGNGWRCSQALRSFFESQVGKGFGFNEPLREFIKSGAGRTLGEALEHYRQSLAAGPRPISEQFEYNNHMREYRMLNPSSTHAQAVAAWWAKRGETGA